MIVPMKQLTLLCSPVGRDTVLDALRALGCVHITAEIRDSEGIRRAAAKVAAAEQALRILDIAEKNGTFAFRPDASSDIAAKSTADILKDDALISAPAGVTDVIRTAEVITRLRDDARSLTVLAGRYAPFGDVSPETLAALADAGIAMTLLRCPVAAADRLPKEAFRFREFAGFVYAAVQGTPDLPDGTEILPPPPMSLDAIADQAIAAGMIADRRVLALQKSSEALRPKLEQARDIADDARTIAEVAANLRSEGEVLWLRGYIPQRRTDAFEAKARDEGWGYVFDAPAENDPNVPVLMEPPKGFKSIGALFKGLGILPGYSEGDCSVPFYAFFSLFFAMLVGDAGYGAIMLTAVLLSWIKFRKSATAKPLFVILTVFCLATVLWGVLSGTYFGIVKSSLPETFRSIPTVDWLGNDSNIMFLCFLIGALHISLARIWNAILRFPSIKALGEIGWLGVTWSMFMIVAGIVVSWYTRPDWAWALLGGSVILILIPLLTDIKHEGVSIGMLPLNVISAMGDIISYVRLFAVGLASVKVAENFNAMALGLDLPMIPRILAVCAILLVGHGLNLAMGALSILVHAVRLNTLEFSNAKGITWSGLPYVPFKNNSQQ